MDMTALNLYTSCSGFVVKWLFPQLLLPCSLFLNVTYLNGQILYSFQRNASFSETQFLQQEKCIQNVIPKPPGKRPLSSYIIALQNPCTKKYIFLLREDLQVLTSRLFIYYIYLCIFINIYYLFIIFLCFSFLWFSIHSNCEKRRGIRPSFIYSVNKHLLNSYCVYLKLFYVLETLTALTADSRNS